MFRFTLLVATFASTTALAGSPADDASSHAAGSAAAKPVAAAASPNQLLPPLPPLASLPAAVAASVDEAPPTPGSPSAKKSKRPPGRKAPEASVRLVVTDKSRLYLTDVERQLDAMLQAGPSDRRPSPAAQAVALSR
ncbi:hypothetical protein [Paraburkholderia sp. BL10I2N1]|uniref:hypothetical protein n=1 Tax=Paraburkholderia sp. BL10I2N1 TaxID=1938796 RepID=UPI001060C28E|nr:hypothetical protein [Paraburkholderia sp. BL10I2N1]TDN62675.1 hypothetical protein B0G77_6261 [Paraburkholderia sp. BL10I2N1]